MVSIQLRVMMVRVLYLPSVLLTIPLNKLPCIKKRRGDVKIFYDGNISNVVKSNILASNGVIHEIDNVILSLI